MTDDKPITEPERDPNGDAWFRGKPATWQEKQATKSSPLAEAVKAWHAHPDDSEEDRMGYAIDAYEDALVLWRECDEPSCTKEAGCGWSTEDGGYRRTCREHVTGMHKP